MSVTAQQIEEIARLAALGVDQSALAALTQEIRRILEYVSQLDSLGDGAGAGDEPGDDPPGPHQPLRDDQPQRTPLAIPIEQFAPAFREGLFVVPRLGELEDDEPSTPTTEP